MYHAPEGDNIQKWLVIGFAALFAFGLICKARGAPNHPDHGAEHFYATWMQPDAPSVSCCDKRDCGPAAARFDRERGLWFARWTPDEDWVPIPAHKIERSRDMPDSQAHLCGYRGSDGTFYVYCFGAGSGG